MANTGLKQFLGAVSIIDTVGSLTYTVPSASASPRNPLNFGYPGLVNASGFPSTLVQGKKSPSITLSTVAKASWFTATFLNNLLFTLDSDNNTRNHTVVLYDNSGIQYGVADSSHKGMRVYTGCRCTGVSLYQTAVGGPVGVDIGFAAITGESEDSTVNSTSATIPSTSAGSLFNISQVAFSTSTAYVRSWRLNLVRGQGPQFYADGTLYANDIVSGMASGSLTVEQSPLGSDMGSAQTITFSSGPVFTLAFNKDESVQDFSIGLGNVMKAYTLFKSDGTNPCSIA